MKNTMHSRRAGLPSGWRDALGDHLVERLSEAPCDHSLRHATAWAEAAGCDADALARSLAGEGGYCDCEALDNVCGDPESPDGPRSRQLAARGSMAT